MDKSPQLYDSFRTRLDAFARELPDVERGHVEALHDTRVASRRLRELLPLLALDCETTRKLTRRLHKVTRQLGTVRELDVLSLLIRELQQDGDYPTPALKHLGALVEEARSNARERLASKLPTAKLQRLADALDRAAEHVESDDTASRRPGARRRRAWVGASAARLVHRATRARSAMEAAGALYAPEPLHAVRIALKKLRYAAELSPEAARPRTTADIAALKAAQDVLGRLHDLQVLIAWGREKQASSSLANVAAWRELSALVHAVEYDCRHLHARYMRGRNNLLVIADRMGASQRAAMPVDHRAAS